jgi:hypothetical protein
MACGRDPGWAPIRPFGFLRCWMVTRNFLRRLLSASLARRSKTPYNLFASNESTRSCQAGGVSDLSQIKSNFMVAPTALLVPLSLVGDVDALCRRRARSASRGRLTVTSYNRTINQCFSQLGPGSSQLCCQPHASTYRNLEKEDRDKKILGSARSGYRRTLSGNC